MDLIYYTKKVYAFARQYERRLALFYYTESSTGDFFDGIFFNIFMLYFSGSLLGVYQRGYKSFEQRHFFTILKIST